MLCHPNVIPRENAPVESTIDGFIEYNTVRIQSGFVLEQLLVWQWDNINAQHYCIYFYAKPANYYVIEKNKCVIVVFYDSLIRKERRITARSFKTRTLNYDIEVADREFLSKDRRPLLSLTEKSVSDWRYPPQPKKEHFFGFAKYEYILSR